MTEPVEIESVPEKPKRKFPRPSREKSIKIRLFNHEYEKLQELKQGDELARWIRNTCLNAENKQTKTDPQLLKELNRIGVNMNQIARVVNQNSHNPIEQAKINQSLKMIYDQLNEVLKKL